VENKRVKTTDGFIKKAKILNGERYDYSKVQYVDGKTKVIIICKEHGEFEQSPRGHLGGKHCKFCATRKTVRIRKSIAYTKEYFIMLANQKHNGKYDYSKVEYKNNTTKVIIGCPIHGEFLQTPRGHLWNNGCYSCGRKATGEKNVVEITKKDFIEKVKTVQKEEYDYSEVPDIIIGNEIITVNCKAHGKFNTPIRTHLAGHGCKHCCYRGYEKNKYLEHCKKYGYESIIFYVILVYNEYETFVKVGITCRSIKERFRKFKGCFGYNYEIIHSVTAKAEDVWDFELDIKRKLSSYKFDTLQKFGGYKECFSVDCLDDLGNHVKEFQNKFVH